MRLLGLTVLAMCLAGVTVQVMLRQAHPFRLVAEDWGCQKVAERTAQRVTATARDRGLAEAAGELLNAWSPPLPPRANRPRPVVFWIWSSAVLFDADTKLQWCWRLCFVLMVLALWAALARLSDRYIASMLAPVITVAPATQGLLSWMSLAGYILMSAFLLGGFVLLTGHRRRATVLAGWVLVCLGLLSREAAFFLLPGAFGLYFFVQGRKASALLFPVLCAAAWVLLRPSPSLAIAKPITDMALLLRGSLLTVGALGASVVRNLGLLTIAPFVMALWPFRILTLLPVLVVSVLTPYGQFFLLILLMFSALRRSKHALFGVAWAAMTIGSVVAYGSFVGRYSHEFLVGLALGMAPGLKRLPRNRLLLLLPFVLWHVATCLWPNVLFSSHCGRSIVFHVDQRYRALCHVTECRETEWLTLAGKAREPWVLTTSVALGCGRADERIEPLWSSGNLHRIGRPVLLHAQHYEYR
ncbi:MAG: hypothetical protein V2A71_05925, partial [Candidatus Eisenbacteria bacterium]